MALADTREKITAIFLFYSMYCQMELACIFWENSVRTFSANANNFKLYNSLLLPSANDQLSTSLLTEHQDIIYLPEIMSYPAPTRPEGTMEIDFKYAYFRFWWLFNFSSAQTSHMWPLGALYLVWPASPSFVLLWLQPDSVDSYTDFR